jgi:hypothetical protein
LKIKMTWSGAAGGTAGGRIGFTNLGPGPCRLYGWPHLVAMQAGGKPSTAIDKISTMFGPDVHSVPVITLRPRTLAEAVFTGSDGPGPSGRRCPAPYRLLRVTPPGNSQAVTISAWIPYYHHYMPACTGLWVSEVVPSSDLWQP